MKASKILIDGLNFAPELTGIGKYTGEMAEWLASRGHSVRVVTAPPYYPAWQIGSGYSGSRYVPENLSGVSVIRCPIWVPARVTGVRRILHLFSFAFSSSPALVWSALRQRPQVIVVIAPALFCAPFAWLMARLFGAKCWLHIQDFEVDAAFELGILKGQWLRALVRNLESGLLRRFDMVSTISEKMLERLVEKGVKPDRAILFPNWVDVDQIFPMTDRSPFRDQLGIASEDCVALYSGNMGKKQGLEILADAAMQLRDHTNLVFVFCGDGVGREELMRSCEGLGNVRFLALQPVERLNELMNLADIHLLPQRSDAADLVMPSKLGGMLASGRPVLATASLDTQLGWVLADCGRITPPGDGAAFAEALCELAKDGAMRARLGLSGRRYAERFLSREGVLTNFEASLTATLDGG